MRHEAYKEMLALEALGALGANESRSLALHLTACAECRNELNELCDAAATLVYIAAPVQPPGELRARILERARAQRRAVGTPLTLPREAARDGEIVAAPDASAAAASNVLPFDNGKGRRAQSLVLNRPTLILGAVAATLIVAALVTALVVITQRNRQMRGEIARLSERLAEEQSEAIRAKNLSAEARNESVRGREDLETETREPGVNTSEARTSSSAATETPDISRAELSRLSDRNEELRAEVVRLSQLGGELRAELERRSRQNDEMRINLASATERSGALQMELAAASNRNNDLRAEITRFSEDLRKAQTELARAAERNGELQAELTRLSNRDDALQIEIAEQRESERLLAAPDALAVAFAGTKKAPQARARLAFDRRTGRAVFFAYNLPPPPAGKTYQLWFIAGRNPFSAGVFTTDAEGRAVLRSQTPSKASNASAFAVTLEDVPGSRKPIGAKVLRGST